MTDTHVIEAQSTQVRLSAWWMEVHSWLHVAVSSSSRLAPLYFLMSCSYVETWITDRNESTPPLLLCGRKRGGGVKVCWDTDIYTPTGFHYFVLSCYKLNSDDGHISWRNCCLSHHCNISNPKSMERLILHYINQSDSQRESLLLLHNIYAFMHSDVSLHTI